ncbi:MAG: PD-(D/E)XK nuclease family protein [Campylobacter gracilis]|uniref:RecB family exonuclease n=1 Tax=Campylobacter gracilis TaxID=824 RepID=UPI0026F07E66|nr:PD-(D/E)XK nuclease family protein [Campylobacter gracilis]MBS6153006.1 PD-(D/E)XK nuclease family protein [Campylobacter gracilis]
MKNLPSKNLFVYTSSRALRAALQSESGGVLAPRITLAEFYEKALFVPDLVACGEIDRALFMKQAVNESKRAGERLKFPNELYEFMRNREYLFGFFKELATERVSIDALDLSDTYAWYAEHFEILRELAGAYARILREHGFYDEITLPALYELNESYLRGFERIEIKIDGNPSAFEFEIFKRAAELGEVVLSFRATTLNSKPVRAVEELCGISLGPGFAYRVNLGTGEILSREPLGVGGAVVCRGFELRSLQASYVFEKISSFVRAGIAPERIAVILPDESFAGTLRLYDERIARARGSHRMLNFAMGEKLKDSLFYVTLEKISQCLKEARTPKFGVDYRAFKSPEGGFLNTEDSAVQQNLALGNFALENSISQNFTQQDSAPDCEIFSNSKTDLNFMSAREFENTENFEILREISAERTNSAGEQSFSLDFTEFQEPLECAQQRDYSARAKQQELLKQQKSLRYSMQLEHIELEEEDGYSKSPERRDCFRHSKMHEGADEYPQRPNPQELDLFFASVGVDEALFGEFVRDFAKQVSFEHFEALIIKLACLPKISDALLQEKLKEPLYLIKILLRKFKDENLSLGNLIDLFLLEISRIKLDDVRGGKVTVMGLLESRGLQFDGVIIPDFNDDLVPKRSSGEMFLNSALRARAGLISHADRENLQRFYYDGLLRGAKKSAICYLQSVEKLPSRFLKSFEVQQDAEFSQEDYLRLFGREEFKPALCGQEDPVARHDFFAEELSFSRLDTFLECKRKYYYRYVFGLKEGLKFGEDNALLGKILHTSFQRLYERAGMKFSMEKFRFIYSQLAREAGIARFDAELELKSVEKLARLLEEHEQIWGFSGSEVSLKGELDGVRLSGRIDRIDEDKTGRKFIIDYKRGSAKKHMEKFQLTFYRALLAQECECAYLSLKDCAFAAPGDKTPSLENLRETLSSIGKEFASEVAFTRTEAVQSCEYCDYKIICKGQIDGKI